MPSSKQNGFFARVTVAFSQLQNPQLVIFARNVVQQMTGNPNYPSPNPPLTLLIAKIDQFEVSVQQALDGGRVLIATRNDHRETLLDMLRDLAAYVTGNCHKDVLTLLTSGFEAVKVPARAGLLLAPANPRLSHTSRSGELLFCFKGNKNARNFSIESALSPEGPWETRDLSTSSRVLVARLTPGLIYWTRSRANGTAGPSEWSVPTSAMAL